MMNKKKDFFDLIGESKKSPFSKVISAYIGKMEEIEAQCEFEPFPEGETGEFIKILPEEMDLYLKENLKGNETLEDFLPNELIAKIFYFRGRRELILKKFFNAGKFFQEAIKKGGDTAKYNYFLGLALLAGRKYSLAESALKAAIAEDKANPYFWHYLGVVYHRGGAKNKALHMWKTVLEINPKFERTREFLKKEGYKISEPIIDKIKEVFNSFLKKFK